MPKPEVSHSLLKSAKFSDNIDINYEINIFSFSCSMSRRRINQKGRCGSANKYYLIAQILQMLSNSLYLIDAYVDHK